MSNWVFAHHTPQIISRFTQTTTRHHSDTFQTIFRHTEAPGREWNQLIKITLIRFLLSINFTSYPHHTTPHNIQSHSVNPRHLPEILQTPYRHPNIGHSMSNPGSLREGTSQLKHISMFLHLSFINWFGMITLQAVFQVTLTTPRLLPDTFQTQSNLSMLALWRASVRRAVVEYNITNLFLSIGFPSILSWQYPG